MNKKLMNRTLVGAGAVVAVGIAGILAFFAIALVVNTLGLKGDAADWLIKLATFIVVSYVAGWAIEEFADKL